MHCAHSADTRPAAVFIHNGAPQALVGCLHRFHNFHLFVAIFDFIAHTVVEPFRIIARRHDPGRLRIFRRNSWNIYPVHVRTRKSFGSMTRKLSVTELRSSGQRLGTCSRRKVRTVSANSRWLA